MRARLFVIAVAALVSGCAGLWQDFGGRTQRQGVSSSLVDFLYPNGETPPEQGGVVPQLALPVRVGLAFVPSKSTTRAALSEARKNDLLEKVKAAFSNRDFIREIVIVPDTYLRAGQGFQTVDQVARMHGLDVIALVSYDQVTNTEDTRASLLYWTIVGAYLVKGSKNDVQTFVDSAIFDVKTRKLLFRAPGTDRVESTTTLVNSIEETRKARERSFDNAMGDMTQNLSRELDAFRERVARDQSVIVSRSTMPSGGGGGASGLDLLLPLAGGLLALLLLRRR